MDDLTIEKETKIMEEEEVDIFETSVVIFSAGMASGRRHLWNQTTSLESMYQYMSKYTQGAVDM